MSIRYHCDSCDKEVRENFTPGGYPHDSYYVRVGATRSVFLKFHSSQENWPMLCRDCVIKALQENLWVDEGKSDGE